MALAACSAGTKEAATRTDAGAGEANKVGVTDSTVTIAYIGDLSGPDAKVEKTYYEGIKLAIDRANANGGVNGRKIDLKAGDTRFDTAQAVTLFKKYTSEQPALALLGINVSSMFEALTSRISAEKVPVIGPTGVTQVTLANPYIYNAQADLPTSAEAITKFLAKQLGANAKVGVARISTASGDEWFDLVKKEAPNIQAEVTGQQKIEPAAVEAAAQVAQFKRDGVAAVTLHAGSGGGIALLKSMQTGGLEVPVYSTFGANGPTLWKSAGALAANTYAFDAFAPPDSDVPGRAELESAMREVGSWEEFKQDKNYAEGWVIGKVVVESLKRAGDDPTRASFIEALRSPEGFQTGGYSADVNWSKKNGLADASAVKAFTFDPGTQRIVEVVSP
ncbi:ABC transporter substrate-binding protein [Acrocarpospora catenulata]|uniref:ABC transporter substrate-binding protein n=1 Tax=Acrocarpospora catenulata TaxID=2836182 RepID=UPI001BDA6F78|nr:ABC transporter substrate-binding protein [Acrocarpospora catenulata]